MTEAEAEAEAGGGKKKMAGHGAPGVIRAGVGLVNEFLFEM